MGSASNDSTSAVFKSKSGFGTRVLKLGHGLLQIVLFSSGVSAALLVTSLVVT